MIDLGALHYPRVRAADQCSADRARDNQISAEVVYVAATRAVQLHASALFYDNLLNHPLYCGVTTRLNGYRVAHDLPADR
jgi:hypothetical protein